MEVNEVIGDDGQFVEGWQDKVPGFKEAVGDSKYFDTVKDFEGLMKDIAPLANNKGKAFVPGKDADEEAWAKFASQLPDNVLNHLPGVPGEKEEYDFEFKDFSDDQRAVAEQAESRA